MKIYFLLAGFLAVFVNDPLYACDIVNKRDVQTLDRQGVSGNCSNNGEKIECYYVGEYSGGVTCDGPEGTMSGYNLQILINEVCGCGPGDTDGIERQFEQELNQ